MRPQTVASTLIAMLIVVFCSNLAACAATQPRSGWIQVSSPENNYVYSSGDVWLKFTRIKGLDVNFSSYTIILDGQQQQIASNETLLHNLPAGSHKLAIYGNVSTGYFTNQNEMLAIVYFNVNYSSNWVTFTLALSIAIAVISVLLFVNRRLITVRLRGKKTALFRLGIVIVVLASFVVVPLGIEMLNSYLFPHFDYLVIRLPPDMFVYGGLIALCVGIFLTVFGSKPNKKSNLEQSHSMDN